VDALNGDPGLFTARYAGNKATYENNMQKLLQNLEGVENHLRTARFRTIISYVDGKNDFHVEGSLEGKITKNKLGSNGFGYDPIFFTEKFNMTLAQMDNDQKNQISHRGLAISKFVSRIEEITK
jgi:XTP/dITP diphosphohydrolase